MEQQVQGNVIERYTKMGLKIDKIFPDDIV